LLVAALVSRFLQRFPEIHSDRYVFPILTGICFFFLLIHLLQRQFTGARAESAGRRRFGFKDLLRPFPRWNLFLVLTGLAFVLYPFSDILQKIGLLPLFVLTAVVDGLFAAILRRRGFGFNLAALTATVGVLIFAWLWEMAGDTHLAVLPVDLPKVRDAQFTPEGATKTLLTAIVANFPPMEPPVRQPLHITRVRNRPKANEEAFIPSAEEFRAGLGRTGLPGGREDILQDAPHVIGPAELGGVPLEPVYHALRHLRHMPSLEAQILLGRDGSLTLGLRRSDFPPSCYGAQSAEKLLNRQLKRHGRDALQELQDELERQKKYTVECNPRWNRKVLRFLGVSGLPGEQDERISNVTVAGLRPDEQLTQLIDRALFEGMDRVSPELLGLFYDAKDRHDSALYYYRQAFPHIVQQASEDGGNARSRLRVARFLMRIAELEARPRRDKDKKWEETATDAFKNAKRHFEAAIALVPKNARAHAHMGYFLLHSTMALLRDQLLDEEEALHNYADAADRFRDAIRFSSEPEPGLEYGNGLTQDLLIFSHKNLALALVAQADLRRSTDPLEEATSQLEKAESVMREEDAGKYPDLIKDQNPEEHDPDILAIRGRISWVRSECTEALAKFAQALPIVLDPWDWERLLLLEETSQPALQKCGSEEVHSKNFQAALHSLALAWDHYYRANYAKSAVDLANGWQAATNSKGSSPRFRAWFPYLRGLVLARGSCKQEEDLDEKQRDSLRGEAESELFNATQLNPTLWEAKSVRAKLLAMSPKSDAGALEGALADATQAAVNEPDNTEFKKALGTVQLRLGDRRGALRSYQEGAELDSFAWYSFDPEVHYLLGFALMQKGSTTEEMPDPTLIASDEWKFARSLDPERWQYISNPLPGCGPIFGRKHSPPKKP
jgi:hypothetical protein